MESSKEMLQKLSHIHWTTNLVNFPLMNSLVYDFWWQKSEDWRGEKIKYSMKIWEILKAFHMVIFNRHKHLFLDVWRTYTYTWEKKTKIHKKTFDDWKIEYIDFYFYYLPSSTYFKIKLQYITSISKIIFSQVKA